MWVVLPGRPIIHGGDQHRIPIIELVVQPDNHGYRLERHGLLHDRRVELDQSGEVRYAGGPGKLASVAIVPYLLVWIHGLGRDTAQLLDQSKRRIPAAALAATLVVNVGEGAVQDVLGRQGNRMSRLCRDGMTALHRTGRGERPTRAAVPLILDIRDSISSPPVDFSWGISSSGSRGGDHEVVEVDDGQLLQLLLHGVLHARRGCHDLVQGLVAEDVEGHQRGGARVPPLLGLGVEPVGVGLEGREAPGLAHHLVVSSPAAVQIPQSILGLEILRREQEAGLHRHRGRAHQQQGHEEESDAGCFHLGD